MMVVTTAHKKVYWKMWVLARMRKSGARVVKDIIRKDGKVYVILDESPKGWWLALKISRMGAASKIYVAREIDILDLPPEAVQASKKRRWINKYSRFFSGYDVQKILCGGGS